MGSKVVFWIVLVCSSLYVPVQSSDQPLYVHIYADSGNDTLECLVSNSTQKPCQTLSFVAENMTQRHDLVHIEIVSDRLDLTQPVEFNSWEGLTINGCGTLIHCNGSDAGIAFVNVRTLVIYSLTMEQCGSERDSTSFIDPHTANETERLNVTIYILNCTDVNISHVDIQDSHGTGLSMYDTNGTVDIAYCNFSNNSVSDSEEGGGGIHIEFTFCSPGIARDCSGHNGRNQNSSYTIQHCIFTGNRATCSLELVALPFKTNVIPRNGRGGGLYISLASDASGNNFTVTHCHFQQNAAFFTGGGMLLEFLNSARNNTVSVSETEFTNNSCLERKVFSTGGGLSILFMFYIDSQVFGKVPTGNVFVCKRCTFQCNDALSGGATTVIAAKQLHSNVQNNITFIQSNWVENTAPIGAGVYISPALWDFTKQGFLLVPLFQDCTFVQNSAFQPLQKPTKATKGSQSCHGNVCTETSVGFGALFVSELHVAFEGETNFTGNNGSAVFLSNGALNFSAGCNVTFYRNEGHNGGAIAMYGASVICISNDSVFNFTNNKAFSKGGAIFTEISTSLQTYHNCFIESSSRESPKTNAKLIFKGNRAKVSTSNSIFSNSLRSCKLSCSQEGKSDKMHPVAILKCIAEVSKDTSISTPPKYFALNVKVPVWFLPGIKRFVNITATDEMGTNIDDIVYEALIHDNFNTTPQVSNNTITVYGNDFNTTTMLYLDTHDTTLSFYIILRDCPPGYGLEGRSCECQAPQYLGLADCAPNTSVSIKQGFWMGPCFPNGTKLCTTFCPYGFCSYSGDKTQKLHLLPDNASLLDSHICGPTRTGTACGECAENHSVYFNSFKFRCGAESLCSVGWIFFILAEIVPLVLLFAVILIFNISFTNGNANGFILFAQILDALATNVEGLVEYPPPIEHAREILTFLYRHLNLNFFTLGHLSFCLWKGSTVMDVLIVKYVTVGIALVLVLMTIVFARCKCAWFKKRLRTPDSVLIHGLSAFFVLCYSQCARVTFHILDFFCLYSTNFHCERRVVNRVGYMTYLHGDHVPYAAVAILVLIFMVILPPLLLLLYPLVFKLLGLCKLSESKLASFLWRVMPIQLLDVFQSSFKDEFRFFAGFYFLYRAMVLAAFSYTVELIIFYLVIQIQLTVMLALHAIFQPYKKKKHNILDALLFTNLAIINGITLYNYYENDNVLKKYARIANIMAGIQVVLIFLPILYVGKLCVQKVWKYKEWKSNGDDLPPLREDESLQASFKKLSYEKLVS